MLTNHLRLAWRNLLRDRQFTALNLIGLSTGLACSLLIYLWVTDERSVDKFNEKDRQLYQVMSNFKENNGINTSPNTPGLLAAGLQQEVPEVEHAVSILRASWFPHKGTLSYGDTYVHASGDYVSGQYFDLFTCPFLLGDPHRLFTDNYTIAISEDLALRLFHTPEASIGKTVKWDLDNFGGSFVVTGVFRKPPANATDQFDILLNYGLVLERRPNLRDWSNSDPSTFVLVRKGTDIARLNDKIKNFIQAKRANYNNATLLLTRYSDKYLYGKFENGVQTGGRIAYVRLFSIIALVILVIACINFMNLSTARAARRIKEVGIKKVMGARRHTLMLQYLGESLLMAFLSLLGAIFLIIILLPVFNELTGKQLDLHLHPALIATILGITVLTGLLAGSYPAFYLSGFRPAAVLKGQLRTAIGEIWVRKGLVVFQFTLSVIFIVAVMVVYRQIDYIQTKDLGYNRDHLVHFEIPFEPNDANIKANAAFIGRLRTVPGVLSASSYYHTLTGEHGGIGGFQWKGKDPGKDIDFANLEMGYNFLETAGIHIREGRNFSPDDRAHNEIIFNEAAIQAMGIKDPLGQKVRFWDQERVIVGVADNFHFESLYETVKPCFFQLYPAMPNVLVRIAGGSEKATLERIETAYHQYLKGLPFDYKFLDEDYQALYVSEKRVSLLSRYFAGLAIIISCLGLFGLAAFTAQKRQKEIGIRKVVGATVSNVVVLLSKDFLRLVLLSVILATPLAYFLLHRWLEGFAYRADIQWSGLFAAIAVMVIIIAFVTVSFQSIRAALMNPTRSLRSE